MAKKSMIAREVKRKKLQQQFVDLRSDLKQRVVDQDLSEEERREAMISLQRLPRDSSRSRQRNRCALTGRPRGYFRRFGLSRNVLREIILRGEAPGVIKASW
ncbi:MAG: 30S ribosomal protein S14 [Pseudomonadota bacterium]|jgi:small subunit ribosomal protein S14|nr:30S ribosomal protein S14 [Pseudomonadota bacterium]